MKPFHVHVAVDDAGLQVDSAAHLNALRAQAARAAKRC